MQVEYTGRQVTVTRNLRTIAEESLERIVKILGKTTGAHIVLTAETEDFDDETIRKWRDEGFDVKYEPLLGGGNEFIKRIHDVGDSFGPSEQYAIVGKCDLLSDICFGKKWVDSQSQ